MTVVNHIQFDSRVHPVLSENQHSQSCHRRSNKTINHQRNGIHQGKYQYYSNAIIMIFYMVKNICRRAIFFLHILSICVFLVTVFIGLGRRGSRWPLRTWRTSRRRPIPVRLSRTVAVLGRTCRLPVRHLPVQSATVAGRFPCRGGSSTGVPGSCRTLRRLTVPGRCRSTVPGQRSISPRSRAFARGRRTVASCRRSSRCQARLYRRLPSIPIRVHGPRLADR